MGKRVIAWMRGNIQVIVCQDGINYALVIAVFAQPARREVGMLTQIWEFLIVAVMQEAGHSP